MDDIGLNLKTYWRETRPIGLAYAKEITAEFDALWNSCKITAANYEMFEVVNSLVARQTTLTIYLAQDPLLWNVHFVPIIQRCIFEIHINLAWIFKKPVERSKQFVEYGLGLQKLYIEHLKANRDSYGEHFEEMLGAEINWLHSQRNPDLLLVDVGVSWSGLSLRDMAQEVALIDYYNLYYSLLNAAVHSNWHFIGKHNVERCENVLHRRHFLPSVGGVESDMSLLVSTVGMLNDSYELYKRSTDAQAEVGEAYQSLKQARASLFAKYSSQQKKASEDNVD